MLRYPLVLVLAIVHPAAAAPRRHATAPPAPLTRDAIVALVSRAADQVTLSYDPRLHWENAVFLDGLVLFGEQLNAQSPGSGDRFIDRAASIILDSDDAIGSVYWGDGTAFEQAAFDLYRVLPPGDPRHEALLATLTGPMAFADRAIHVTPRDGVARDPWWIAGGYGTRFWQDDMYMLVPWLSLYGSAQDGLPANETARNLAYEWIESYVYDHRPDSGDARERTVPSSRARRGALLWDEATNLFQHSPELAGTKDFFWARGNGWSLVALERAAEALDAPYTGGRYDQIVTRDALRPMLARAAESLLVWQLNDGGWASFLTQPKVCDSISETSGTALLTFFLARGINEGWLDRDTYRPAVMRAFELLRRRVDSDGYVTGIQPPDTGPGCSTKTSREDPYFLNLNYGPGALLLASSEVLKLM